MASKPDTGQLVEVFDDDNDVWRKGVVVDALSSQFTFIPFSEKDIRRVRFCFYNGDWR